LGALFGVQNKTNERDRKKKKGGGEDDPERER
jgi:hypothetical protein